METQRSGFHLERGANGMKRIFGACAGWSEVEFCDELAGMAGLEPASEGVKVPCLTTWLHPCMILRCACSRRLSASLWGKAQAGAATPACRLDVGWVKGLEPSTPGTTIRCSNQLSYTHHITDVRSHLERLVRLKGLEPPARCLEGSCSIHLSYRRIWSG